jgi:hypothetical protein
MHMEIYFSPELIAQQGEILNVVDEKNQPVGYFAFIMSDKKMYIYGHLEKEGVTEAYKGMVKAYIHGLSKNDEEIEVFSYIAVGGKKLEINKEEE